MSDKRPILTRLWDNEKYYKKYSNIDSLPLLLKEAADRIEELEEKVIIQFDEILNLDADKGELEAENARLLNTWIPIGERLPEGVGEVLIYSPYQHFGMNVATLPNGLEWAMKNEVVTHWMPLPEPPEPTGEDE